MNTLRLIRDTLGFVLVMAIAVSFVGLIQFLMA